MFKKFSKILVNLFLLLIVASFALWGVGDIIRGGSSGSVAEVGNTSISRDEFLRAMNHRVQNLREQTGRNFTEEEIIKMGLKDEVIQSLIQRQLWLQQADLLGIRVPKEYVLKEVMALPAFLDDSGKFSKDQYFNYLNRIGLTEDKYIQILQSEYGTDALKDAITLKLPRSQAMADNFLEYEREKRVLESLIVPADFVKQIADPSDAELATFYETVKDDFVSPESRDITYLEITEKDVVDEINVSEAVLKETFEANKEQYGKPEIRNLEHILFSDEAAAQDAYSLLQKKPSFKAVVDANKGLKVINFGKITRAEFAANGLIQAEAVEEIFSLQKNGFSKPFATTLGWHIFQVTDINPAKLPEFSDAKEQVKSDIIKSKSGDLLYALSNDIQDQLASGKKLSEIVSELNLSGKTLTLTSDKKHENAEKLPAYGDFWELAFKTDLNSESEMVASPDGLGYFILRVDNIVSPKTRALDDVKSSVTTAWKAKKKQEKLLEIISEARAQIDKRADGATLEGAFKQAALSLGLKTNIEAPKTREEIARMLQDNAYKDIFNLKLGEVSKVYALNGGYAFYLVKQKVSSEEDKEANKTVAYDSRAEDLKSQLDEQLKDDLIHGYVQYMSLLHDVKVNR